MEHKIPSLQYLAWRENNLVPDGGGKKSSSHVCYIIANKMSGQSCPSQHKQDEKKCHRNYADLLQKKEDRKKEGREGRREEEDSLNQESMTQKKEYNKIPYNYFILYNNK